LVPLPGLPRRASSKTSYLMQERLKFVWIAPFTLSQINSKEGGRHRVLHDFYTIISLSSLGEISIRRVKVV